MLAISLGTARAEFLDRLFRLGFEAGLLAVNVIEAPRDLTRDFDMRHLILAHWHAVGAVYQDVRALQQRITEKAIGGEVFLGELFLLILIGRHAFQPTQWRDHRQQQMQLGVLRHTRLDKQRRLRRIHARRQPVDHHVPHMLLDGGRIVVMGGQRMPVGNEVETLVFMLQTHPILEHAMIVAEMQCASRAHAG